MFHLGRRSVCLIVLVLAAIPALAQRAVRENTVTDGTLGDVILNGSASATHGVFLRSNTTGAPNAGVKLGTTGTSPSSFTVFDSADYPLWRITNSDSGLSGGFATLSTNQTLARLDINNSNAGSGAAAAWSKLRFMEGTTEKAYLLSVSSGSVNFGNGGANQFRVWNVANAPLTFGTNNVERMRIDANGNVGVNTQSPWGGLHLVGAGQIATNPVVHAGATGHGATLFLQDTGDAVGNGGMVAFGWLGGHFAAIKGSVTDGTGNARGRILFATRQGTSDPFLTERMRIDWDGRVMIGTTSPNGALHVFRNINGETSLWASFDAPVTNSTAYYARAEVVSATLNVAAGVTNPGGATASHMQALNTGPGHLAQTTGIALYAGNNGTGTVGAATGAFIQLNSGQAGGSLTSGTGVFIQDIPAATAHAIYQNGSNDLNYFAGRIGIGNPSPAKALDVTGDGHFTGDMTVDGNIGAKYQDVAEWVPSREDLQPGTVVILDPSVRNTVTTSRTAYDTTVAGVVSAQPGIILGIADAAKEQIATTGRVKVRVDATAAPIRIGDLLVTSEIPGTAMKSRPVDVGGVQMHRPGTIIGKALEPLPNGQGEILVLLSLQ